MRGSKAGLGRGKKIVRKKKVWKLEVNSLSKILKKKERLEIGRQLEMIEGSREGFFSIGVTIDDLK